MKVVMAEVLVKELMFEVSVKQDVQPIRGQQAIARLQDCRITYYSSKGAGKPGHVIGRSKFLY